MQRINPAFHAGMCPRTAYGLLWCGRVTRVFGAAKECAVKVNSVDRKCIADYEKSCLELLTRSSFCEIELSEFFNSHRVYQQLSGTIRHPRRGLAMLGGISPVEEREGYYK